MKKQPELLHLVILVIFGMINGAICNFNNYGDCILAGFVALILIISCVHLRKNRPKWISLPFNCQSLDQEEIDFRHEAWKKWEENVQTRMFALIVTSICSFLIGVTYHPILFPNSFPTGLVKNGFSNETLVVFSFILALIVLYFVHMFIKKEKELYNQHLWTKSYILERLKEKIMAEEIMDGTYQE